MKVMTTEQIIKRIRDSSDYQGLYYATRLCDAYEALRAKVEGLEKDADKLRIYEVAINRIAAQGPSMTPRETWVHWSTIAQQAIDAAMAKEQVRT